MRKGLVFELLLLIMVVAAFVMTITAVGRMDDSIAPLSNIGERADVITRAHDSSQQTLFVIDEAAKQAAWDSVYTVASHEFSCETFSEIPVWLDGKVCIPTIRERVQLFSETMKLGLNNRMHELSSTIKVTLPQDNYDILLSDDENELQVTGFANEPLRLLIMSPQEYARTPVYSYFTGVRLWTRTDQLPSGVAGRYTFWPSFTINLNTPYDAYDQLKVVVDRASGCGDNDCVNDIVANTELQGLSLDGVWWNSTVYVATATYDQKPAWEEKPPKIKFVMKFSQT